jgi:hypothetical protein
MHLQSSETGNLVHVKGTYDVIVSISETAIHVKMRLIDVCMCLRVKTVIFMIRPTANSTKVTYIIEDAKIGTPDVKLINFLNMCIYSIFAKFIPCFCLNKLSTINIPCGSSVIRNSIITINSKVVVLDVCNGLEITTPSFDIFRRFTLTCILQSSETGNLVHVRRIIRARIAIFAICACSVLILIPNYMSTNLESRPTANSTKVTYIIEDAKIGTPDVKLINLLSTVK